LIGKEIIEKLKSIGFKEYEAKVLLVLLKGIPMSASDIAKEAKLIRNSIYDTLKSFAEKGYCNEIETNTVLKYQVIDPRIIADKVEKEYNETAKKRISTLRDTFENINELYTQKKVDEDEQESIELIRGFNRHRSVKYLEFFNKARFEILAMSRLRGLVTDEINEFTQNFVSKGGKIKSIYMAGLDFKVMKGGKPGPADSDDLIRVCRLFESFGEEVKLTIIDIPNLIIADRERVFLNISGKKNRKDQTDLIIHNEKYANNMVDLFNQYWVNSFSIGEYEHGNK
jgi:sugar-specific transcriptional regulator TrmB